MELLKYINIIIAVLFTVVYSYQYLYIVIATFRKPKRFHSSAANRFAVLVSARNEEKVIIHLINSIKAQDYPSDLVDIYVVADNCTDNTAAVAKAAGAVVIERFNDTLVGKGYALNYLFAKIYERRGKDYYDGYFVFDADNLLEPDYIAEMNRTFTAGYRIVTSFRNSKNFSSNWISAGNALWFIREAVHLNNARMILGTSCAVSGTGFLFHKDIAKRNNGWNFYQLTEDIEFTVDSIVHGEKVGYCHDAVFYDEQPEDFKQSFNQRMRWTRGNFEAFCKYGPRLISGYFKENGFSCFDISMTTMPAIILSMSAVAINVIMLLIAVIMNSPLMPMLALSLCKMAISTYLMFFALGLCAGIKEHKRIICPIGKRMLYFFTFPIFMFTYLPITALALFKKVKWTPINHNVCISFAQCKQRGSRKTEKI